MAKKNKVAATAASTKSVDTKAAEKEKKVTTAPKAEVKDNPKPDETADGATPLQAEEVKPIVKDDAAVPTKAPKLEAFLNAVPESGFYDGTSEVLLLNTMERHVSRMKPDHPMYVKMSDTLSHGLAWAMLKLRVQFLKQQKELNMVAPNEELSVAEAIETFNSMGVAIEAHVDPTNPKQQVLEFKEISPETEKAVEEEVAAETAAAKEVKEKAVPVIELDPLKWNNDDEARAGLYQIGIRTKETYSTKFNKSLMDLRAYRINTETDPVKKSLWEKKTVAELTQDWIELMGTKNSVLLNSIASAALSSLKADQNPVFAHCILRRNFPQYSDSEIAGMLKVFIEANFKKEIAPKDPKLKLEDCLAVKGILAPTVKTFEHYLMEPEDHEKKIKAKLLEQYKEELPPIDDPTFKVKAVNKMIEIRNLYVDPAAAFPLMEGKFPA